MSWTMQSKCPNHPGGFDGKQVKLQVSRLNSHLQINLLTADVGSDIIDA